MLRPEGYTERALFVLDRYGIIRFIDIHDIDHQPENELLFDVLRSIDPQAAARQPKPKTFINASPLPERGVVIYCTSWCPGCKRARRWLDERNIAYTEVDIYSTPGAKEQLIKWTGGNLTTPTFNINGDILINLDESKLASLLKKNGLST